jgi:hypothetical protein
MMMGLPRSREREDFERSKFVTLTVTNSGRSHGSLAEDQNVVYNQTISGNLGAGIIAFIVFFREDCLAIH